MTIKIYPGFENPSEIYSIKLQSNNIFRGTDLYKILDVNQTASKKDIIKQYQKLSKSGAHPDKGGSKEEWGKVEIANVVLKSSDRGSYDGYLNRNWWKYGENTIDNLGDYGKVLETEFRVEIFRISSVGDAYVNQRLTSDLRDWKNQFLYNTRDKTVREINSYCQRLIAIRSSIMQLEAKAAEEEVRAKCPLHQITQAFEGLQSKTEIEGKFSRMSEWIENQADNNAGIRTKFKTRRVGKRKIQGLPNWNLLDDSEKQGFLNQVEGVRENYELADIVEKIKRRIKQKVDDAPGKEEIKRKKAEYIGKLKNKGGWDSLLEPEEQDYLENKITDLSLSDVGGSLSEAKKEEKFQLVMDYATKFLRAAWVRKHYFPNFWEKLEAITTLEKEDIYGSRTVEEGGGEVKIGERYKRASSFLSPPEPSPQNLDAENLLKFKLFFHFWEQPLNGRGDFNFLKTKLNFEYGSPKDSGWKPKKSKKKGPSSPPPPPPETIDQVRNKAIQEIENHIDILKGQGYWGSLDDSDEWYQWTKRYQSASEKSKIAELKKQDLNWLYRFSAKKAILKTLTSNSLSIEILRLRDDNLAEHLKSFDGQSLIETEKNRLLDLINNYGNNKDREIDEAIQAIEAILREKGLMDKASQILGSKWKEDFQGLLSDSEIEEKKSKIITKINAFVSDEVKEKKEAIAIIEKRLKELGLSDNFLENWRDNFAGKNKEEIEVEKNRLLKLIEEEINRKESEGEISSEQAKQSRKILIDETKKEINKKVREELKKGHQKLVLEEKDLPPQIFAPFKSLAEKLESFEKIEEVTEWEEKLLVEVKKGKEAKLNNIKNEAVQEIKKELNQGNYELGKNQNFEEVIKGMVDPDDIERKKLDILKLIAEQKNSKKDEENTSASDKSQPISSAWPKRIKRIGIAVLLIIGVSLIIFAAYRLVKKRMGEG